MDEFVHDRSSSRGSKIAIWSATVYCAMVALNRLLAGGIKPTVRIDAPL
jgi:hypothetical protein